MRSELPLRSAPEAMRARYRREGMWTDDTLGELIKKFVLREGLRAEHATRTGQ